MKHYIKSLQMAINYPNNAFTPKEENWDFDHPLSWLIKHTLNVSKLEFPFKKLTKPSFLSSCGEVGRFLVFLLAMINQ